MSAAASAYGTIIWGIKEANTGSTNGAGSARTNAGVSTGRRSSEIRSPFQPERRLIDHRSRAQQAPVDARALEALEIAEMRPVGRSHLW